VQAAIRGVNEYQGRQVFLEPGWVRRLSGIFAGLYFRSLGTFTRPEQVECAWKIAHRTSANRNSTVVQNALCGINAHINYDLAHAIARNLVDHDDLHSTETLALRKFDHDQVNNLLVRSLPYIQVVLAHDYGPGIAMIDHALGPLDERISDFGLKYYRERVWNDALAHAAADRINQTPVVRQKLNWESYKIASVLTDERWWRRSMWWPEKVAVEMRGVRT
jgi:hypothetical protein